MVIFVTGSRGFIGRHVCELLRDKGYDVIECCVNLEKEVDYSFSPDILLHLASHNGGIQYNNEYPFDVFSQNQVINIRAIKMALKAKKFITLLTSCGYPSLEHNLEEDFYLTGKPEEIVSCHGYVKRNLLLGCQFAQKQYGLNYLCLCPNTVYGPGDSIDPIKTKVMMALIKNFVEAKKKRFDKIVFWGTGEAIREFIFVKDLANIIEKSFYLDLSGLINVPTGQVYSIKDLAEKIKKMVEYEGRVVWDNSKPDGQRYKVLDDELFKKYFDFTPTTLDEGIKQTIKWIENHV